MRRPRGALVRTGLRLDVAAAAAELDALASAWIPCPDGLLGEHAIPLVSVGGTSNFDYALAGPLRATAALERSPALARVLARVAEAAGGPISRARVVRLGPGAHATFTGEAHHHWSHRAPVGVPLVGAEGVVLACEGESLALEPGEPCVLDPTRALTLLNRSEHPCACLVVELREPVRLDPCARASDAAMPPIEPYRFEVPTPAELAELCDAIVHDPDKRPMSEERRRDFAGALARVQERWRLAFERHGHHARGELDYQDAILELREQILAKLPPGSAGLRAATLLTTALQVSPAPARERARPLRRPPRPPREPLPGEPSFDRPLFIVSAPRSGSTLLFDLVATLPEVWTIGGESHELVRAIPELHPARRGWASDRLERADATPEVAARLRQSFAGCLRDRAGRRFVDHRPPSVRFVEKTPANALRIPFLHALFPDARFVHLHRDPAPTIGSLVEGWRSRRFIAYRELPGWPHRGWSFLLPPGWQRMTSRSLVEIATFQWQEADRAIRADLAALPEGAWIRLEYDALVERPAQVLDELAGFAELRWDREVDLDLAPTHVTLSPPARDKWRRHEHELQALLAGEVAHAR